MDPFTHLVQALRRRRVRFVVIGVWGANYYARDSGLVFNTEDRDLFLPLDPRNELRAWQACAATGFDLWIGEEPLDHPRHLALAREVVKRRALVRATYEGGPTVDLTLVMSGFRFERVYAQRRVYRVDGIRVDVARLRDIVASKAAAGRPKDRLFLAAHEEALRGLLTARRQVTAKPPPARSRAKRPRGQPVRRQTRRRRA